MCTWCAQCAQSAQSAQSAQIQHELCTSDILCNKCALTIPDVHNMPSSALIVHTRVKMFIYIQFVHTCAIILSRYEDPLPAGCGRQRRAQDWPAALTRPMERSGGPWLGLQQHLAPPGFDAPPTRDTHFGPPRPPTPAAGGPFVQPTPTTTVVL